MKLYYFVYVDPLNFLGVRPTYELWYNFWNIIILYWFSDFTQLTIKATTWFDILFVIIIEIIENIWNTSIECWIQCLFPLNPSTLNCHKLIYKITLLSVPLNLLIPLPIQFQWRPSMIKSTAHIKMYMVSTWTCLIRGIMTTVIDLKEKTTNHLI